MFKAEVRNVIGNLDFHERPTLWSIDIEVKEGSFQETIEHPASKSEYYILTEKEYKDLIKKTEEHHA